MIDNTRRHMEEANPDSASLRGAREIASRDFADVVLDRGGFLSAPFCRDWAAGCSSANRASTHDRGRDFPSAVVSLTLTR